jgi:hypothetical protein
MNLILQIVCGSLRYKCRGSRQSWHSVYSANSGSCTQGEVTDAPVFLQLVAHSLPSLILAKLGRSEAHSPSPLSIVYLEWCVREGVRLSIYKRRGEDCPWNIPPFTPPNWPELGVHVHWIRQPTNAPTWICRYGSLGGGWAQAAAAVARPHPLAWPESIFLWWFLLWA